MLVNGNIKPSGQASYLKISIQNVETTVRIFTVVFKVMTFKTTSAMIKS